MMRGENTNPFLISPNRIFFPFLTDFPLGLQFISWFSFLTGFNVEFLGYRCERVSSNPFWKWLGNTMEEAGALVRF